MENSKKINYVSLAATIIIAAVCITMSLIFYQLTKIDYVAKSSTNTDSFKINEILYNKIVNNIENSENIQANSQDFGRENPFDNK